MTTEDTLPVVAYTSRDGSLWRKRPSLFTPDALVRQSDALAALTLVQAERDAALVDAESWQQQADSRTADAVQFGAERDAMQQERDELRTALQTVLLNVGDSNTVIHVARAALTPKATQQETRA